MPHHTSALRLLITGVHKSVQVLRISVHTFELSTGRSIYASGGLCEPCAPRHRRAVYTPAPIPPTIWQLTAQGAGRVLEILSSSTCSRSPRCFVCRAQSSYVRRVRGLHFISPLQHKRSTSHITRIGGYCQLVGELTACSPLNRVACR